MLDDFLTYVEDSFAELGPFRTLSLAHGNPFRQSKRLRQLLGEAVGAEVFLADRGAYVNIPAGSLIGAKADLRVTVDAKIELIVYSADTLTQARVFYQDLTGVTGVRNLLGRGWQAGPHFHFGYMQRGFCWTRVQFHGAPGESCRSRRGARAALRRDLAGRVR